jgi:hypothetical protein
MTCKIFEGVSLPTTTIGSSVDLEPSMHGSLQQHSSTSSRTETRHVAEPSDWWHAAGKGKDGASEVFPSWADASHLVLRILGAVVKKHLDCDKAGGSRNPRSSSRFRKDQTRT